jgi:serine/threonine protein phosphatase PrpC
MDPIAMIEIANLDRENNLDAPYIIGSSITGVSHIKNNLPCQDAYRYNTLESSSSIIVISDGLGSAKHSDVGSTIAVESTINYFNQIENNRKISIDELPILFKNAVEFARDELEKKANFDQNKIQSYACTLIVIYIIEKTVIVAQIGDGAVVGKNQNGYAPISVPEEQEYVNEVTPITSTSWEESIKISSPFLEVEHIAAFTDGCQRAILL